MLSKRRSIGLAAFPDGFRRAPFRMHVYTSCQGALLHGWGHAWVRTGMDMYTCERVLGNPAAWEGPCVVGRPPDGVRCAQHAPWPRRTRVVLRAPGTHTPEPQSPGPWSPGPCSHLFHHTRGHTPVPHPATHTCHAQGLFHTPATHLTMTRWEKQGPCFDPGAEAPKGAHDELGAAARHVVSERPGLYVCTHVMRSHTTSWGLGV